MAGKETFFKGIFCNTQRLTLQEIPLTPGAFTSVLHKTKFSNSFQDNSSLLLLKASASVSICWITNRILNIITKFTFAMSQLNLEKQTNKQKKSDYY